MKSRWFLDETNIKVNGKWCYLHRTVNNEGKTIDFLLTHREEKSSPLIISAPTL